MNIKPGEVIELVDFASLYRDSQCSVTDEHVRHGARFVTVSRVLGRSVLEVYVRETIHASTRQLFGTIECRFVLFSSVLRVRAPGGLLREPHLAMNWPDPVTSSDMQGLSQERRRTQEEDEQKFAAENHVLFVAVGHEIAWKRLNSVRRMAPPTSKEVNETLRELLGPTRARAILAKVRR